MKLHRDVYHHAWSRLAQADTLVLLSDEATTYAEATGPLRLAQVGITVENVSIIDDGDYIYLDLSPLGTFAWVADGAAKFAGFLSSQQDRVIGLVAIAPVTVSQASLPVPGDIRISSPPGGVVGLAGLGVLPILGGLTLPDFRPIHVEIDELTAGFQTLTQEEAARHAEALAILAEIPPTRAAVLAAQGILSTIPPRIDDLDASMQGHTAAINNLATQVAALASSSGGNNPVLGALSLSANGVTEGAAPGTLIGVVVGKTANSTLTLTVNPHGWFDLVQGASLWEVRVAAGAAIDYETEATPAITITETLATATNSPRPSSITISVNDVLAPAASSPPVIVVPQGGPMVGQQLTTVGPTYTVDPDTEVLEWLRNGLPITGATDDIYAPTVADQDAMLAYRVTATNGEGSVTFTSNPVGPVLAATVITSRTLTNSPDAETNLGFAADDIAGAVTVTNELTVGQITYVSQASGNTPRSSRYELAPLPEAADASDYLGFGALDIKGAAGVYGTAWTHVNSSFQDVPQNDPAATGVRFITSARTLRTAASTEFPDVQQNGMSLKARLRYPTAGTTGVTRNIMGWGRYSSAERGVTILQSSDGNLKARHARYGLVNGVNTATTTIIDSGANLRTAHGDTFVDLEYRITRNIDGTYACGFYVNGAQFGVLTQIPQVDLPQMETGSYLTLNQGALAVDTSAGQTTGIAFEWVEAQAGLVSTGPQTVALPSGNTTLTEAQAESLKLSANAKGKVKVRYTAQGGATKGEDVTLVDPVVSGGGGGGGATAAMVALPTPDPVALNLPIPADATAVAITQLPVGAAIGPLAGGVVTPLAVGGGFSRAQGLTWHVGPSISKPWIDGELIVTCDTPGGPVELRRSFRMTEPWWRDAARWTDAQVDAMLSTFRHQYFQPTQFSRCWYLKLRHTVRNGDWYDAAGVFRGPARYPNNLLGSSAVGGVRTVDVTQAVVDCRKTITLPPRLDGTADTYTNVILTMLTEQLSGEQVNWYGADPVNGANRPRLVLRQGGNVVGDPIYAVVSATCASGDTEQVGGFTTFSTIRGTDGPRVAWLEFDLPPANTYDSVELQLTVKDTYATNNNIQARFVRPFIGIAAANETAPKSLVRDPAVTNAHVIAVRRTQAELETIIPASSSRPYGGAGSFGQHISADLAGKPGSARIRKFLPNKTPNGNGIMIAAIPRYEADSPGGEVVLKAPADQPYYGELWLRFAECFQPSMEWLAWGGTSDKMGGGEGKGAANLANTYENFGGYDPQGANDPQNLIGTQQGGYGGGQISPATFSNRIGNGGYLPDGHYYKGLVSRIYAYIYWQQHEGKREGVGGVAHTQKNYAGQWFRQMGVVHYITQRVKMNTFVGDPIYGTPNQDGEFDMWVDDRLLMSKRDIIFSDLPNFGISEVGQLNKYYMGGLYYQDFNPPNRQIHMYGWGELVISTRCLGLGPIP